MLKIIIMCNLSLYKWNKRQSDQSTSQLKLHGYAEEAEGAYKFLSLISKIKRIKCCSEAQHVNYGGILTHLMMNL